MIISEVTLYDLAIFEAKYRWAIIMGLVLQLFVDLVNTTSLCVLLRVERTGFHKYAASTHNRSPHTNQ